MSCWFLQHAVSSPQNKIHSLQWFFKILGVTLDVFCKGHIISIHHSSNENAFSSGLKQNSVLGYNKEDKRVQNLDVNARVTIRNSLPYHIYRLVQIWSTAQEMMNTLSTEFDKEELSNDEDTKGKCLMAWINESHTEAPRITSLLLMMTSLKLQSTPSLRTGTQPQCIK